MEKEGKKCITETKVYLDVVENQDILKLLRFTYSKGSSTYMFKEMDNKGYRHLCYNFFVFLINCHSTVYMTRYIVPSCVMSHVRQQYPDERNDYTGFKAGHASVLTYRDF